MYWDNNDLTVAPYERKKKKYHCGRTLLKIETKKKVKFTIVIIDLSETYCAKIYNDGEIKKIFSMNSDVPGKHGAGGQSQRRFERGREQKIIHYFKRINEKLTKLENSFIIGINFVYKNRLEKYLSTENMNKLIRYVSIEYSGFAGCSQFRNTIAADNRNI